MRICRECHGKMPESQHGVCRECASIRSHNNSPDTPAPSRTTYAHLYQSATWTRCSKLQRQRFPICERCRENIATLCDHVIPAEIFIEMCREQNRFLSPERAFFWAGNHQSLCDPCHSTKTDEDKNHIGRWPDLFENPRRAPKKWSF
jgi:hypothetical protein